MARRMPVTKTKGAHGRQPMASAARFSRTARTKNLPPPVGGWNARDSLSSMRAEDAVRLRNWFPQQSDVISRPGYALHCDTGEPANVEMLMPYEYGTNTKLLAACNNKLIDVTTDTPDELASAFTSDLWSHSMLSGLMFLVNGADVVQSFDGTTIAEPAFTGATLTDLIHVSTYKKRLFFVKKNSQTMYYAGVASVAGALTAFNFQGVASIEGNLMFTAHLTGDGGDGGNDDIFVAVFEGGDVLAYTGSDPGDDAAWSIVGHYSIGRPLSRFSYIENSDDVYVATTRGYEKLSEMVKLGKTAPEKLLLSYKIQKAVTEAIESVGADDGWRMFVHPMGQMLIVTVPRTSTARNYHVQNINTSAWCEFGDFLSYSWGLLEENPFFGGSGGKVYAFDQGNIDDNGIAIECDAQTAWTHLGLRGIQKKVELIRPVIRAETQPSIMITAGADYETIFPDDFEISSTAAFAIWDEAEWDAAEWSSEEQTVGDWGSRSAIGDAIGFYLAASVSTTRVRWNELVVIYTSGGYL